VIERATKYPDRLFYWQTKNPACLSQYVDFFPENTVLLTTIETNRDAGYREISKAPLPTQRYEDFLNVKWPRKIITIEPILDFDIF
jgi:hypothetical protein